MNMDNSSADGYSMLSVDPLLLTAVGTCSGRKDKWLEMHLHHLHQKEVIFGMAQTPLSSRLSPSAFRAAFQGQPLSGSAASARKNLRPMLYCTNAFVLVH